MNAFPEENKKMLEVLQTAHDDIDGAITNPQYMGVKHKVLSDLRRHITSISLQLGVPIKDGSAKTGTHKPLGKLFGKQISEIITTKPTVTSPTKIEQTELGQKVAELYSRFVITPTDDILDNIPEIEIRGVAIKAGLPFTETNPAKVTADHVEQIKKAIQLKGSKAPDTTGAVNTVLSPEQQELNDKVQVLYPMFKDIANKDILDTYSDIEIRGVAKKAGLPVTENSPKKIDGNFLNVIKEAIVKKAKLDAAGK